MTSQSENFPSSSSEIDDLINFDEIVQKRFQEFAPGLLEVKRIDISENGQTSRATIINLNPLSKGEKIEEIVTIDMDDTSNEYTKAKEKFHERTINLVKSHPGSKIARLDPQVLKDLLLDINKGARLLPPDRSHPEAYSPKLELAAITFLIHRKVDFQEYLAIGDGEDKRQWVRDNIIKPTLGLFPEDTFQEPIGEDNRTYFARSGQNLEILFIPEKLNEQTDLAFKQGENDTFEKLLEIYQDSMFAPQINENIIPTKKFKGRFILATFGETRFQLIKTVRFLRALKKKGLRLPNEIIFFEQGRKGPILKKYLEDCQGQNPACTLTHIDNSKNQCESLNQLRMPNMQAIYFDPKNDRDKNFDEIVSGTLG